MYKISITKKGFWLMITGVAVMVLGFILMMGGGSDNPNVFNYEMFNFPRTVLSPLLIVAGVLVVAVGIMGPTCRKKDSGKDAEK